MLTRGPMSDAKPWTIRRLNRNGSTATEKGRAMLSLIISVVSAGTTDVSDVYLFQM